MLNEKVRKLKVKMRTGQKKCENCYEISNRYGKKMGLTINELKKEKNGCNDL